LVSAPLSGPGWITIRAVAWDRVKKKKVFNFLFIIEVEKNSLNNVKLAGERMNSILARP